jgi:hypothetical protein
VPFRITRFFDGIPFAVVRAILSANDGLGSILEATRRFHLDPEAFERGLTPDSVQ